MSDIVRLLCTVEEFDKASVVINKLATDQQKILGEPEFVAMEQFVQLSIANKQPSKAIQCLQYCTEIGFEESRNLAKKICKEFTLDEHYSKKVAYLVGIDVLHEVEQARERERERERWRWCCV